MQVLNMKAGIGGLENVVYIGRAMKGRAGSPLGNPFMIGRDGDRDNVIELYRKWLHARIRANDIEVCAELKRIQAMDRTTLKLVCWCKPLACHGDVLLRCLNWMDTQTQFVF